MFSKKVFNVAIALGIGAFFVFGTAALNPAKCAEEAYDVTACNSLDVKTLVKIDIITVISYGGKGIVRANGESKIFDNCTVHLQGLVLIQGKKKSGLCYIKNLDPDGNVIIFKYTQAPGESGGTMSILGGTGKWKGVTGGGKTMHITKGKPVAPDTMQYCTSNKGVLTFPE